MAPNASFRLTATLYKPGHLRQRSRQLVLARTWGLAAIGGILGAVFVESEVDRLRHSLMEPVTIAYFALLFMTAGLLFVWIWATERELDLLFRWLDPKGWSPPSDFGATATILGFAVVLTCLVLAARNPVVYGSIFSLYSLAILFSVRRVNRQLKGAFDASASRLDEDDQDPALRERAAFYRQAVMVLRHYFLERPHTPRHVVILATASGGLLMAAWARNSGSVALTTAAYAVFFGIIGASEGLIVCWRNVRDARLMVPEAALHEIERSMDGGMGSHESP